MENLEKKRITCATLTLLGIILLIVSAIFFIIYNVNEASSIRLFIITIILAIPGLIVLLIGQGIFKKLRKEFKHKYLGKIIQDTYSNCVYEMNNGVSMDYALSTRIIPRCDRYSSEDLIKGSFEDVDFITCDIKAEERRQYTDSKGNVHYQYVTIFLGRLLVFEFNKNFEGITIGSEDIFNCQTFGLKRRKFESDAFNKKYKVYTNDDLNAFYIITPQIIERLMELEQKNKGRCSFSFINNKFFFAINNSKDTFELSLFKKINDESMNECLKDVFSMRDIIKDLKLNLKIYKKEI